MINSLFNKSWDITLKILGLTKKFGERLIAKMRQNHLQISWKIEEWYIRNGLKNQ